MKTGGIESSSEDLVLFTIFMATILWVYTQHSTMLWDLWCDWELFSAVAWARELLASLPEIRPVAKPVQGHCTCDCVNVAARVGDEADVDDSGGALQAGEAGNGAQAGGGPEGRNYAVRMRVLAGRGFSYIAQLVELLADMGTCESPLRVLQAVPLGVAVAHALPILVVLAASWPFSEMPKVNKPAPFSGRAGAIDAWASHMDTYVAKATAAEALLVATSYLKGEAFTWWQMYA